ncbi:nuclear factor 7, brain-like [Aquarana catesbeiana]|uniref:nuclear factor 7, brain-like n=1 Tax=Aquarana catesbeiana TaxID=8400 RepID=UPI003CC946E4
MASSDLREELDCPVCLNIYTDPVTLRCGHNFCQVCIDRVLETQEGSGNYSCPQCRRKFRERPSLERNITLCKITQRFLSAPPEPEKSGISCTYCLHTSKRKCSVHKKILEFYCNEDSTLTCAFCVISEEHRGHQLETLEEAFLKKKIKLLHDGVDPARISHMINTGLANKRTRYISGIHIRKTVDILDVDTAHDGLCISPDKKIAVITDSVHRCPDTTGRFKKYYQVLGSRSFSSGRQYWEVDVHGSNEWKIGMCYASIARDGDDSLVGCNDVSWGLHCWDDDYMAMHDNIDHELPDDIFGTKLRVYLDYEAGQLSFYMCDPLRHLHTFSATFTEPLYAVLCVEEGFVQI